MRTVEIQVILHCSYGDVVTSYTLQRSGSMLAMLDDAMEHFGQYVADGKNASMKTILST